MKRILTLLLTAILVISCAGCSVGNDALNETAQTFTQVVQNAVNRYGIIDEEKSENRTTAGEIGNTTGVMAVESIDITQDGEDELLLMYLKDGINIEIYEMEKSRAVKKWSQSIYWNGRIDFDVFKGENCTYWTWEEEIHKPADVIVYANGEYKSAASLGELSDDEIDEHLIVDETYGAWSHGEAGIRAYLDRLGIKDFSYSDAEYLYQYHSIDVLYPINTENLLSNWNITLPKPKVSPMQALEKIMYYGDRSICKMDKQMAQAYLDAIESEQNYVDTYGNEGVTTYAILMDVAGDGIPLLLTVIADNEESDWTEVAWIEDRESFNIWTYDGKKAEKYDFSKDLESDYTFGYMFYPKNEGAMIVVGDGVSTDVGGYSGNLFYNVSNAQLKLTKHTMYYSAFTCYENPDIVRGASLPGIKNVTKDEYGFFAPIEEFYNAGWYTESDADDEFKTFSVQYTDGKKVPYSVNFWDNGLSNLEYFDVYYVTTGSETIDTEKWTKVQKAKESLALYKDSVGKPYYSLYTDYSFGLTEEQIAAMSEKAAQEFGGTVGEIFKLGDDLYYVTIYIDGEFAGGTVVKNTENGASWTVIESKKEAFTEQELTEKVSSDNAVSNITIDYTQTKNAKKYLDKVFADIDGTVPNDTAKSELADYAQKYITDKGQGTVKAKDNHIVITEKTIEKACQKAINAQKEVNEALTEHNVKLNKQITVIVKIICKNLNPDKSMQIIFDSSSLKAMEGTDAIYIELADGYGIKKSKETLTQLVDAYSVFAVTIAKENETHIVQFTDNNGEIIEKLPVSVGVILPAENELYTIYSETSGGTDNWGGQFDATTNEISFETNYSGKYTAEEEKVDIADISDLSEEHQKAIRFMVSKGYFSLTDGVFNPNGTLTRYAFSEALVRMFFALDRSIETNLSDVPKDSPYYYYVASGEAAKIIMGYDDNTFRGENDVLTQEVLALCSRTLRERKGYIAPEDPMAFLHFADNDRIAEWAKSEIALAVRETLISDGGTLSPESAISRADSALLLYRLFMLLYEVEPVTIESSGGASKGLIIGGASALVLAGAGVAAGLILRKKKKKSADGDKTAEEPETTEE